jgi:fatty-acyl-CoA synthase
MIGPAIMRQLDFNPCGKLDPHQPSLLCGKALRRAYSALRNLAMNLTTPWHARLAFILALLLPIYFVVAALGTKFGAWGWQFGLLTLTAGVGLALMGAIALLAIVSLVLVLRKPPRIGWSGALGALFAYFAVSASAGASNPISDVATDIADPPQFSPEMMAARAEAGANPLNDYATPLGDTEMFAGAEEPLASKSHAQIIAETYPDLKPIPLGETSTEAAANAIELVMAEMGFMNIRYNPELQTVEGMAETFWYGFRDDIVARIGEDEIDLRSVSRVGRSDLGKNAERIMDLRERIAGRISAGK